MPLAALGLDAAILLVLAGAVTLPLLPLAAGSLAPTLLGAASLAMLPPSVGFAALYELLQALFGATRIGSIGWQFGCACAVAAAGLAWALGAWGALRVPSWAPPTTIAMARAGGIGIAALNLVLGAVPGAALLLARPGMQRLVPSAAVDVPLFAPAAVMALLAGITAALWFATRSGPVQHWPAPARAPVFPMYLEARLDGLRASLPGPRAPSLREWLLAAGAALLMVLIVLASR